MANDFSHIDFEHLKRYLGDDASLTSEVFGLFKNQVDMWSPRLRPDIEDESWAMMTHSLKGTARAIGAMSLADLCEQAESYVGDNVRSGARDVVIDRIRAAIGQIIIEIQRWEYRQTIKQIKSDNF